MVKFEWDEDKNEANVEKHGLDFEDASEVFDSPMLVALDMRQDYGEDRCIGLFAGASCRSCGLHLS